MGSKSETTHLQVVIMWRLTHLLTHFCSTAGTLRICSLNAGLLAGELSEQNPCRLESLFSRTSIPQMVTA